MLETEYLAAANLARVRAATAVLRDITPTPGTRAERSLVSVRYHLTQIEDELDQLILIHSPPPPPEQMIRTD